MGVADHRVVDAQGEQLLEGADDRDPVRGGARHTTGRVGDADEVDPVEGGQDAGVVAAHHAQADEASAQVRHQAPAFATALTASTIVSRSAWLRDGWTGSEITSVAACAVSGRSRVSPNEGRAWTGVG